MTGDKKLARCIFNTMAQERYLNGNANGLQFRIRQGTAYFRPVTMTEGKNVLELDYLPTGRRSIDLTRSLLGGHFIHMFEQPGAFLIFHDDDPGDWIEIEHVNAEGTPKVPYARIWPVDFTEQPVGSADHYKITQAQKVVLAAVATLHEYAMEKLTRPKGRRPKEVQEAMRLVDTYRRIMPDLEVVATKT